MTLDDGREDRITPESLILARTPDADVEALREYFHDWEIWIAGVTKTRTAFPMLVFYRPKHEGQNWVTALDLSTDAALLCQLIEGAEDREPYWCLRCSMQLVDELTQGADVSAYEGALVPADDAASGHDDEQSQYFEDLYRDLQAHGFTLLPIEEGRRQTSTLRNLYAAKMEYLINELAAPRGFWGHVVGHQRETGRVEEPSVGALDE